MDDLDYLFNRIREHVLNGTTCPNCGNLVEVDEESDTIKCQECGNEIDI